MPSEDFRNLRLSEQPWRWGIGDCVRVRVGRLRCGIIKPVGELRARVAKMIRRTSVEKRVALVVAGVTGR